MNVGIVGHEKAKFTAEWEGIARELIRGLLFEPGSVLVSGGCHLGGVDVWAEEEAKEMGCKRIIHRPKVLSWAEGYKPRNLLIAKDSDEVHVIVVRALPPSYRRSTYTLCYHCNTKDHVKSGACWTARQAMRLGKPAFWHLIP